MFPKALRTTELSKDTFDGVVEGIGAVLDNFRPEVETVVVPCQGREINMGRIVRYIGDGESVIVKEQHWEGKDPDKLHAVDVVVFSPNGLYDKLRKVSPLLEPANVGRVEARYAGGMQYLKGSETIPNSPR